MRCLYRNVNATSNEGPGTLFGDVRTNDTGERRAIDQFKYAFFPTDRIAEEKSV
jgi:hypothetical protein